MSLDVVIEDLIVEDEIATARLVWSGTRATGERISPRRTIEIVRVAGGLAIEHWGGRLA